MADPGLDPALRVLFESAWERRDKNANGRFYVGVLTTGIFCQPSCSARPLRRNIRFLTSRMACLEAGFRACKRCKP